MKAPKKDAADKNPDFLQEPATEYINAENYTSEEEEEMHPILIQLLEKAIKESEQGLGISHEEMMRKVKEKYPFINGM
ncbi:hypothetical protein MCEGE10_00791 [Flavobacteriaceae bacterium]